MKEYILLNSGLSYNMQCSVSVRKEKMKKKLQTGRRERKRKYAGSQSFVKMFA